MKAKLHVLWVELMNKLNFIKAPLFFGPVFLLKSGSMHNSVIRTGLILTDGLSSPSLWSSISQMWTLSDAFNFIFGKNICIIYRKCTDKINKCITRRGVVCVCLTKKKKKLTIMLTHCHELKWYLRRSGVKNVLKYIFSMTHSSSDLNPEPRVTGFRRSLSQPS